MENKVWCGETKCDICHKDIHVELYDAITIFPGKPWATMCTMCFKKYTNHKLGTGFGQKYIENKDREFEKTNNIKNT